MLTTSESIDLISLRDKTAYITAYISIQYAHLLHVWIRG